MAPIAAASATQPPARLLTYLQATATEFGALCDPLINPTAQECTAIYSGNADCSAGTQMASGGESVTADYEWATTQVTWKNSDPPCVPRSFLSVQGKLGVHGKDYAT